MGGLLSRLWTLVERTATALTDWLRWPRQAEVDTIVSNRDGHDDTTDPDFTSDPTPPSERCDCTPQRTDCFTAEWAGTRYAWCVGCGRDMRPA